MILDDLDYVPVIVVVAVAGWREVFFVIGAFTLVVVLSALMLVLPHGGGLKTRGNDTSDVDKADSEGASLAQALSSTMLWRLAPAVMIVSGFNLSMNEMMRDRGMMTLGRYRY